MIGKAYKLGTGFKGLAAYLETGRDGTDRERVDWIESRNLGTRDPQVAARIMAATARESVRTEKPVYHFSISFGQGDPVDRDAMRRVADRTLKDLGLEGHQVLIVAHRDRAHPHVHFVVNRVNPETGRAWDNSWDYPRIERSLRAQEAEMGLRIVPGKHAPVPEQARERARDAARAPGVAKPTRGDAEFMERVRAQAGPHLQSARSWAELERGLAEHGLAVRMKGRGMVVTDGRQEVKASDVHPQASRFQIEKRLGSYGEYKARQAVAARALEARAPAPAQPTASPHSGRNAAPRARPRPAESTYWREYRRFSDALAGMYENPAQARGAFVRAADRDRAGALAALRDGPEQFGPLRVREAGERQARARGAAEAAEAFVQARAERPRPTLKELAAKIREYEAALERSRVLNGAVQDAGRAKVELQLAYGRREYARQTLANAREAIRTTYADPAKAERAIWRAMQRRNPETFASDLRERPERFGALRGKERRRAFGLWRQTDTSEARASAPRTAQAVETAGKAVRQAPNREELATLRARVDGSQRDLTSAKAAGVGRDPHVLRAEVGSLMHQAAAQAKQVAARTLGPIAQSPQQLLDKVVPPHVRQLAAMVRSPQLAFAKAAWDIATRLARGEEGRGERDTGGH